MITPILASPLKETTNMNKLNTANPFQRTLKPILLAAGLTLAGFGVAVAGDHGHRDPVAKMAERLALDDSQKSSVQTIFESNRPAMKALHERSREHRKAMKALDPKSADYSTQAQALADEAGTLARDRVLQRTQMQSELSAVLTPEQMSKMKEHRGHKRHGGWKGKGGKDKAAAES